MNVRAIIIGFVVGVMLASATVALGAAVVGWYVDSEGEASGSLGALSPLVVTDARGGDGLLPGETMSLRVDIENPNRVALSLASVDIGDLRSGDGECDESLTDSRLRFDRTPEIVVAPGSNDGVVLGSVRLPKLLAQACQSEDVRATVSVRAAYGS